MSRLRSTDISPLFRLLRRGPQRLGRISRHGGAVIALALTLLLWAGVSAYLHYERKQVLTNAEHETSVFARVIEEQTVRTLQGVDQVLFFLRAAYLRDPLHFDLTEWGRSTQILGGLALQLSILDAQGISIASSLGAGRQRTEPGDRTYLRPLAQSRGDELYIGKPELGRLTGVPSIQVARSIRSADGTFDGIIVAALDPDYFANFYDSLKLGRKSSVTLVGLDGIIRARSSDGNHAAGQSIAGTELFTQLARSPAGTFVVNSAVDGTMRIYGYRALEKLPLVVSVGSSYDEVLAPYRTERRSYFAVSAVLSLAVLMVLALRMRQDARLRQAHGELRHREQEYRRVVETIRQVIFETDATGLWTLLNPAWTEITGFSIDESIGKSFADFIDPRDRPRAAASRARLYRGEVDHSTHETRFLRKDGGICWIEVYARQIVDDEGNVLGTSGTMTDITGRREAEEALRASEASLQRKSALLELTLENISHGIILIDADHRVPVINRRAAALLDLPAALIADVPKFEDLLKFHWQAEEFGPEGSLVDEAMRNFIRAGGISDALQQYERHRPNGTILEVRSIPLAGGGAVKTFTDVTERRKTEAILRERETVLSHLTERQTALLDALPAHVALVDAEGRILAVNKAWTDFARLNGESGESVAIDQNYLQICDSAAGASAEAAAVALALREVLSGASPFSSIEYPCHTPTLRRWFRFMAAPLFRERRDGAVIMHVDVTAAKLAEEEIREAKAEAEAAGQTKAKFLATMSHEMRTPLNGVIGLTGLLLDTDLDEAQRPLMMTLQGSADHLLQLINHVLDFSKLDAGRLELEEASFELEPIVQSTIEILAPRAHAKGLAIGAYVSPHLPRVVRGDASRLRQVLLNLAGNGVKFTEHGGVAIEVEPRGPAGENVVVEFAIRDTGIGISAEAIPRLFDEFSQLDGSISRRFGGTGLGLSISRKLVDLMGGSIAVESIPDSGSVFRFALSLGASPAPAAEPDRSTSLADLRILVCDGNPIGRRCVERQLAAFGATVSTADSTAAALKALRDGAGVGAPFDIALIDEVLPAAGGKVLAGIIRADPTIARTCLMLAGSASWTITEQKVAEASFFEAVLAKPLSPALLEARLRRPLKADGDAATAGDPTAPSEIDPGQKPMPRRARILVAEDNPTNQLVVATMLERMGHYADVVGNGLEAVEALQRAPYDLVLMDVMMPEMDGLTATKVIRALRGPQSRIAIIALTANALRQDADDCFAAGMVDFLAKPIRRDMLEEVIDRNLPMLPEPNIVSDGADATGTGDADEPLFDRAVFEQLKGDVGEETALEVLAVFFRETNRRFATMKDLIAAADRAALGREVHSLKSAAATFGFASLAAGARHLEARWESLPVADLRAFLDTLEREYASVRDRLLVKPPARAAAR
jgi:PAS domain S-box-containing protein